VDKPRRLSPRAVTALLPSALGALAVLLFGLWVVWMSPRGNPLAGLGITFLAAAAALVLGVVSQEASRLAIVTLFRALGDRRGDSETPGRTEQALPADAPKVSDRLDRQ